MSEPLAIVGASTRAAAASPLRFYFSGACAKPASSGVFNARGSAPVSARLLMVSHLPQAGADNVLMEWGAAPDALHQSRTAECARGCAIKIAGTPGAALYVRSTYRAGQAVRSVAGVKRVPLP